MDQFDESHAHTARCWWDCDDARWVCVPVVDTAESADDHGTGDRVRSVTPSPTSEVGV